MKLLPLAFALIPGLAAAQAVPTRTIGAVWRKSSARREVILALAAQIEAHAL